MMGKVFNSCRMQTRVVYNIGVESTRDDMENGAEKETFQAAPNTGGKKRRSKAALKIRNVSGEWRGSDAAH